jgi:hypothetical protein
VRVGLTIVDKSGNVVLANRAARRFFGEEHNPVGVSFRLSAGLTGFRTARDATFPPPSARSHEPWRENRSNPRIFASYILTAEVSGLTRARMSSPCLARPECCC